MFNYKNVNASKRNEWPNILDEFKLFSIKNKLSLIHVIYTIIIKLHIYYYIYLHIYKVNGFILTYTFYMQDNVNTTKYYYTFYYARIPYIRSAINVNLMDVSKHVLFCYIIIIIIILLIFFTTTILINDAAVEGERTGVDDRMSGHGHGKKHSRPQQGPSTPRDGQAFSPGWTVHM